MSADEREYRLRELEAELGRRIEAVEVENRRLVGSLRRRSLAGLVAVLALAGSWAAWIFPRGETEVAGSLEARRFVLHDGEGLRRAVLGTRPDGTVRLTLKDRDGRSRVRMSVLADGSPGVSLADREGQARAVLGLLPDGTTTIVFADGGGVTRAVMGLSSDGASRAIFADRNGRTRSALGVDEEGAPHMGVVDVEEQEMADGGSE